MELLVKARCNRHITENKNIISLFRLLLLLLFLCNVQCVSIFYSWPEAEKKQNQKVRLSCNTWNCQIYHVSDDKCNKIWKTKYISMVKQYKINSSECCCCCSQLWIWRRKKAWRWWHLWQCDWYTHYTIHTVFFYQRTKKKTPNPATETMIKISHL